jgi:integrase/recombinase XerD
MTATSSGGCVPGEPGLVLVTGARWPGVRRRAFQGRVGGPLPYDAAHSRWKKYCTAAGAGIGIHQLRHAHVGELINGGVSIEMVRRRLGRAFAETTRVYALLADQVAGAEVRAGRRKRDTRRR